MNNVRRVERTILLTSRNSSSRRSRAVRKADSLRGGLYMLKNAPGSLSVNAWDSKAMSCQRDRMHHEGSCEHTPEVDEEFLQGLEEWLSGR